MMLFIHSSESHHQVFQLDTLSNLHCSQVRDKETTQLVYKTIDFIQELSIIIIVTMVCMYSTCSSCPEYPQANNNIMLYISG